MRAQLPLVGGRDLLGDLVLEQVLLGVGRLLLILLRLVRGQALRIANWKVNLVICYQASRGIVHHGSTSVLINIIFLVPDFCFS
jgi:hypothetical protein